MVPIGLSQALKQIETLSYSRLFQWLRSYLLGVGQRLVLLLNVPLLSNLRLLSQFFYLPLNLGIYLCLHHWFFYPYGTVRVMPVELRSNSLAFTSSPNGASKIRFYQHICNYCSIPEQLTTTLMFLCWLRTVCDQLLFYLPSN